MTKISDLKAGDVVAVSLDRPCLPPDRREVKQDEGGLYVECDLKTKDGLRGRHRLDQMETDEEGDIVGVKKMTKLADLRAGDTVVMNIGDNEGHCIPNGDKREVRAHTTLGLYVDCAEGRHFLDGQENEDGTLVGVDKVEQTAAG